MASEIQDHHSRYFMTKCFVRSVANNTRDPLPKLNSTDLQVSSDLGDAVVKQILLLLINSESLVDARDVSSAGLEFSLSFTELRFYFLFLFHDLRVVIPGC